MTALLQLPALLEAAGVTVRVLDGWEEPHYSGEYKYREPDGEPAGHMHHHTAGTRYRPNRDKANGYAGLSYLGSDTLYQERYEGEGYEAVYTIANAYPAPISSGAGDKQVLEKVRAGLEVRGRQGADTPNWYGNTHYWNTEWVLNGIGAPIDQEVWEMMVLVCQVQNELMGWTPNMHISHGHHTRRKVDLWGGQFAPSNQTGFDNTLAVLRDRMEGAVVIPPPIDPPIEPEKYMYVPTEYSDGFNSNPGKRIAVAGLQGGLKLAGYADDNSQSADGVDGKYGRGTERSVKKFQLDHGLMGSGKADVVTRAKIEEPT